MIGLPAEAQGFEGILVPFEITDPTIQTYENIHLSIGGVQDFYLSLHIWENELSPVYVVDNSESRLIAPVCCYVCCFGSVPVRKGKSFPNETKFLISHVILNVLFK